MGPGAEWLCLLACPDEASASPIAQPELSDGELEYLATGELPGAGDDASRRTHAA